jgi:hypothetical protein
MYGAAVRCKSLIGTEVGPTCIRNEPLSFLGQLHPGSGEPEARAEAVIALNPRIVRSISLGRLPWHSSRWS